MIFEPYIKYFLKVFSVWLNKTESLHRVYSINSILDKQRR